MQGKCGDGSKVSHNYSHRVATFEVEEAAKASTALQSIRKLLEEVREGENKRRRN